MNFVFTEKKMSSSDDLRAYAEKKIGKLEKLFRGEATAYVTFRVERNRNIAEVTVNANGMFYRASESTNDMYVSIDAAVAALTRQVRKYKTRLEKRIHENVLDADFAAAVPVAEEDHLQLTQLRHRGQHPLRQLLIRQLLLRVAEGDVGGDVGAPAAAQGVAHGGLQPGHHGVQSLPVVNVAQKVPIQVDGQGEAQLAGSHEHRQAYPPPS